MNPLEQGEEMAQQRGDYDYEPEECPECGHRLHVDACQFEPGDKWVEGMQLGGWVAMAPCGCTEHRFQALLAKCYEAQQELNASRDTKAVLSSHLNWKLFWEKVGGHV